MESKIKRKQNKLNYLINRMNYGSWLRPTVCADVCDDGIGGVGGRL